MKTIGWQDGTWIKRDMTAEEIAELKRLQAEMPELEPTPEERLSLLESTSNDIILVMADLIGGGAE